MSARRASLALLRLEDPEKFEGLTRELFWFFDSPESS